MWVVVESLAVLVFVEAIPRLGTRLQPVLWFCFGGLGTGGVVVVGLVVVLDALAFFFFLNSSSLCCGLSGGGLEAHYNALFSFQSRSYLPSHPNSKDSK